MPAMWQAFHRGGRVGLRGGVVLVGTSGAEDLFLTTIVLLLVRVLVL